MSRKRLTPGQTIDKLRDAGVHLAQGESVPNVCRVLEVSELIFHRRRKEFGGLKVSQAKRLRDLEPENARLKRLVAEPALANHVLKGQAARTD